MSKKKILIWELIGFVLIVLLGSALHFCFEWSGNYKPLAVFCAVNESVWEHLKLAFWPSVLFALIEYFAFGKYNKNFLAAKAISFLIAPILIIVLFYGYTAILGSHNLVLDILIFVIAVLAAQLVSYKILVSPLDYSKYNSIFRILLLIEILAFSLLTYFPPKTELFKDPLTGTYGIPKK